jgi:putative Holliday junction resolvase
LNRRFLGIDYGDKRIGLAISDTFGWSSHPLETISRPNPPDLKNSLGRIAEIAAEYDISGIVIGDPISMNGCENERTAKTAIFVKKLQKMLPNLQIFMQDERLTSVAAERIVQNDSFSRKKREDFRKNHLDKTAAALILQIFLEKKRGEDYGRN